MRLKAVQVEEMACAQVLRWEEAWKGWGGAEEGGQCCPSPGREEGGWSPGMRSESGDQPTQHSAGTVQGHDFLLKGGLQMFSVKDHSECGR